MTQFFSCGAQSISHPYSDIIMSTMASQITCISIIYSTVCPGADQRKHLSPVSLTFVRHWPFVRGIHRWPVNSPHKGPVMRKMFPFDDVFMTQKVSQYHASPRVLSPPGHQQAWYWQGIFLSFLWRNFHYLPCIKIKDKCKYIYILIWL